MVRAGLRTGAALILTLWLSGSAPRPVQAHAALVRSDPGDGAALAEPPREARLWFDENISPRFSSAQLFDAQSQPIEILGVGADPAEPNLLILTLPNLPPGLYSILYNVLSDVDGHVSRGLLVFGVGEGALPAAAGVSATGSASPWPEVFLRWLNFSLLAALAGAVAVARLVLAPTGDTPAGEAAIVTLRRTAQRRVLGWAVVWGGSAWVLGLGLMYWQSVTVTATLPEGGSIQSVGWQVVSQTRWGTLWLVRQGLLLAFVALAFRLYRSARIGSPPRSLAWASAGLLSFGLMTVQALTGHAAALSSTGGLAVAADALHLLGASLWVGGLLALVVGLAPLIPRGRADFAGLVRAGWRPFSRLAGLSVGLLAATGLYSMGQQVASLDALITTRYGQFLLGKIGLVLGVGALGLLNSILLRPSLAGPLARRLGRPPGWTPLSARHLPALVLAEVSLGLLVLFATSLVTAAPSPRGPEFNLAPEDIPVALSQTVDDVVITLAAKPNRPGQNVFTVFASSTRRPPPAEILRVILRFTYPGQDLGRVSAAAEEVAPGRYLLAGNYLSLAGAWQIEVVVRRRGIEDSVAQFNWTVAPPGQLRPVVISKHPLESPLTVSAALIAAVILMVTARARLRARRQTVPQGPAQHPYAWADEDGALEYALSGKQTGPTGGVSAGPPGRPLERISR